MRLGIASVMQETNTFSVSPSTLENFVIAVGDEPAHYRLDRQRQRRASFSCSPWTGRHRSGGAPGGPPSALFGWSAATLPPGPYSLCPGAETG